MTGVIKCHQLEVESTFITLPPAYSSLFVQRHFLRRLFSCRVKITRLRSRRMEGSGSTKSRLVESDDYSTTKTNSKKNYYVSDVNATTTEDSSHSSDSDDLFSTVLVTRRKGTIIVSKISNVNKS